LKGCWDEITETKPSFSLHSFSVALPMTFAVADQKGIWQVTSTKHNWDHVDFVGQDSKDTKRTREE
jgi:triacylglycerol lipase